MNDSMEHKGLEETFIEPTQSMVEANVGTANTQGHTAVPPNTKRKKRKKKPFIIGGVVLVLALALVAKFSGGESKESAAVLTDMVFRGSITSTIEGNGRAQAQNQESIMVSTSGTVLDVYVKEGDFVTAGTALYHIDSPAAADAVEQAQQDVTGYENQLKELYEAKANLNVRPEFSGKIMDVEEFYPGDDISAGQKLCRLVDDSQMVVKQYYSYAYEQDIYVGQSASVSVPAVMEQVAGKVSKITMVERISAEGSKLFAVEITVDNPGTLTEDLVASAIIKADGMDITPYEQGKLQYLRSTEMVAKVSGEVISNDMQDYLKVSGGAVLMRIDGADNDNEIFRVEGQLEECRETLEKAEENKNNLQAVAPIDGTVVGLAISPGMEIEANSTVVSIIDTSMMIVEASIDERSVSYITPGIMAEIDQWGNITMGIVDSVSLSGSFENGMTTYPAKIMVDNSNGMLNSNGSVVYRIEASESDDCLLLPIQCVKSVPNPETGETQSVVFVKSPSAPENAIEVDGTSLGVPSTGYYAVAVETGISDKYNVEILSGVEEFTEVFSQVIKDSSW